jgi:hypothetical protein
MSLLRTESRRGSRKLRALVAALLLLSGPGCTSLALLNFKTEKIPTADAEHPAIEVLAVWQAAEGPGPKGIPTRGFAGQIFFFSQDRATPVAVDGTARIYVFDDHGTVQDQARPLHQFDFDRESWRGHLQMPKIGPTYGVFIPYTRSDYHQAVCSLRVRFTPLKGRPLYSASSTIVLPGPAPKAGPETAQLSPLSELAKKLQAQAPPARPWANPTVNTSPQPFNMGPQIAAAQVPSQVPVPVTPQMQVPGVVAAADQAPQRARVNGIVQTAGTLTQAMGGAPGESTIENAVGSSETRPLDSVQPSGRIKLQSATAVPSAGDWSSRSDGLGSADDERPANGVAGPPIAHANHPLAD